MLSFIYRRLQYVPEYVILEVLRYCIKATVVKIISPKTLLSFQVSDIALRHLENSVKV